MGLRARPLYALVPAGLLVAGLGATGFAAGSTSSPGTAPPSAHGPIRSSRPARLARPATTTTTTVPAATTTTVAKGPIKIIDGGSVTVGVPYLPIELNPATPAGANPVTAMIMAQVWPSTFVVAGAGNEQASTAFVDSAENVSVSPQTVVYTIDPNAHWSDGTPIDAADFVAEWQAQLNLGPSLPANDPLAGYEDIRSITGSRGGKIVTVVFKRPDSDWEALFSTLAPSVVAARYGWSRAFMATNIAHVVSGGPFQIASFVPGKELVLERNPSYWGPPPHLDKIVFKVVKGQAATVRGLVNGTIDVADLLPGPTVRDAVASSPGLVSSTSLSPLLWKLDFNLADPTVGPLLVREAITTALDRVEVSADSIGLLYPNDPSSGNHLFLVAAPSSLGNDAAYGTVDVPLADRLFAQAGYKLGADGILRDAVGMPLVLRLSVPTGEPLVGAITAELRAQLLDAGVVLRIDRFKPAGLLSTILPEGRYQLALAPYLVSPFPSENATYYEAPVGPTPFRPASGGGATQPSSPSPTTAPPAGGGLVSLAPPGTTGSGTDPGALRAGSVTRNVLGYRDPSVDSLLAQAFSDLNPLSMASLYDQADVQIWADLPDVPLYQVPEALVSERGLLNLSDSPTWVGPLWNGENWALQALPAPTGSTTTTSVPASTATTPRTASGTK